MTTRIGTLLLFVVSLVAAGPVAAQSQQSDGAGAVPLSDGSGALVQSDQAFVQSDEVQIRMNDIASTLADALREGTLGSSVTQVPQPVAVSRAVTNLLLAPSRDARRTAEQAFADLLTAMDVPAAQANALAATTSGLLKDGSVQIDQVGPALTAFNAVVDAAPPSFLAAPPAEFVAVRVVLMALLDGAAA
jgi:hypothetical protein